MGNSRAAMYLHTVISPPFSAGCPHIQPVGMSEILEAGTRLSMFSFHRTDRLIGTARSSKVSVALGFQELPQLEADYGKVGMQKIVTTVGNVVSGSARAKETLEWLFSDIFGKVVQLKKGVTIDRDKTSINLKAKFINCTSRPQCRSIGVDLDVSDKGTTLFELRVRSSKF